MDHHFPGTSHLAQLGLDLGNFEARSRLTLFVEHLGPFLRSWGGVFGATAHIVLLGGPMGRDVVVPRGCACSSRVFG